MSLYYDFDDVDAFTTGAIGRPGERVFFLQARRGGQRVSVKCEKQQAAAIAQYLRRVLHDVPPAEGRPLDSALELATPVEAAFTLGSIGLGYDRQADRRLLQLDELVPGDLDDEDDEVESDEVFDDDPDRSRLRVHLTRGQAIAFCDHAEAVVAAGRPACIFCGLPKDPDGHACPRMN